MIHVLIELTSIESLNTDYCPIVESSCLSLTSVYLTSVLLRRSLYKWYI